ncbi:MAG TPA: hypothetical protein VG253_24190 [Streptosporangiaceae bacterium]|nr:hypothetical protein [Streptosporangiaceae bacterium]
MKRHRIPSATTSRLAVCAVLGLAGSLAVTACGSVSHPVVRSGLPASAAARNASTPPSALAASSQAPFSRTSRSPSPPRGSASPPPAVAANTVVFNCLRQAKAEPANFILTCADADSVLAHLSWASWTSGRAVATGVHELNDCTPNCAVGKFRSYPAVVTFWRSEPVAGHPGEDYFTRITVHYTGPLPPAYTSNGHLVQNPATWTESLATVGGAA